MVVFYSFGWACLALLFHEHESGMVWVQGRCETSRTCGAFLVSAALTTKSCRLVTICCFLHCGWWFYANLSMYPTSLRTPLRVMLGICLLWWNSAMDIIHFSVTWIFVSLARDGKNQLLCFTTFWIWVIWIGNVNLSMEYVPELHVHMFAWQELIKLAFLWRFELNLILFQWWHWSANLWPAPCGDRGGGTGVTAHQLLSESAMFAPLFQSLYEQNQLSDLKLQFHLLASEKAWWECEGIIYMYV